MQIRMRRLMPVQYGTLSRSGSGEEYNLDTADSLCKERGRARVRLPERETQKHTGQRPAAGVCRPCVIGGKVPTPQRPSATSASWQIELPWRRTHAGDGDDLGPPSGSGVGTRWLAPGSLNHHPPASLSHPGVTPTRAAGLSHDLQPALQTSYALIRHPK